MGRRRVRIVPDDCREMRVVHYMQPSGEMTTAVHMSDPDSPEIDVPLIELLGVLTRAEHLLIEEHDTRREEA